MPEVGIDAVQFEQVVMVSFFQYFSLIEDEDPVRIADSGKPVGNDESHGICGTNSSVDSLNNENGADSANNATCVGN